MSSFFKLFVLPPVPHAARESAARFGPSEQRCLIENRYKDTTVELAHVLDRQFTTEKQIMDSIEWAWGLRKGSLNLDTSRNIFFLDSSIFELYKTRKWILVPEESVVDRYLNKKNRPLLRPEMQKLQFEDTVYKYTFVPVSHMEDIVLARQSTDNPSEVILHEYPFDNMPTLISHVDPKFVILQSGSVLSCSLAPGSGQNLTILQKILRLYMTWIARIPACHITFPDYILPKPKQELEGEEPRVHPSHDHRPQPPHAALVQQSLSVDPLEDQKDIPIVRPRTPPQRIQPLLDMTREWYASLEIPEIVQQQWYIENDGSLVDSKGPRKPVQFSARWSPESIREWAQSCCWSSEQDCWDRDREESYIKLNN
ncbi:hypothetical protein CVT24_012835 [Panaeolus cyanescens]|uniref:HNH nuclease domain-containing protein n=1 Tax=Panaeolus cyanescens TaxID=181874 RepID=A0A409W6L0_9AGAR|nr:hypothetical protein CVT24_012835 [Panaeolus cyanescens]